MVKSGKLLIILLYSIYIFLWGFITIFIGSNIKYGMFKPFISYYGILSIWLWGFIAIIVLSLPIYLRKFVKAVWAIPIISISITSLSFFVFILMITWAVTA